MVDVVTSYPQQERELMLPLKRRLEALGLILFVDVDGRLDGSPTSPKALDQGLLAVKAVLGCWSPWALKRPRVLKVWVWAGREQACRDGARRPYPQRLATAILRCRPQAPDRLR